MASNNAGTIVALGVVGVGLYLFRNQLKAALSPKSGDFVAIAGTNALRYVGTPTDTFEPSFGTQDLSALFNVGKDTASQAADNPFRTVAGTGLTASELLNLPIL